MNKSINLKEKNSVAMGHGPKQRVLRDEIQTSKKKNFEMFKILSRTKTTLKIYLILMTKI